MTHGEKVFNDLPDDIQTAIAFYLDTANLCFFASTNKRSLKNALPVLTYRQKNLLQPPNLCLMAQYERSFYYTPNVLYACGNNKVGQLGLGKLQDCSTFTSVQGISGTIQQVTVGCYHIVVWTNQGLYVSGENTEGQLGLGDTKNRHTFVPVKGISGTIKQVETGAYHTVVLTDNGLYISGTNYWSLQGFTNVNGSYFTLVENLPNTIQQIITGANHILALTDRSLYAIGYNGYGQLGLGDKTDRHIFTSVNNIPGTIQKVIAGSNNNNTWLITDHGLYACGSNIYGALGLGDTKDRTVFTLVKNLPGIVQQVSPGAAHTLVITDQGLYACGYNSEGQLGLDDTKMRHTFVPVKGLSGTILQVAAGSYSTLVLTDQGLYACGSNSHGQLGLGNRQKRSLVFVEVKALSSEIQRSFLLYRHMEKLIKFGGSNNLNYQYTEPSISNPHKRLHLS